ncbi:hypothetical protein SAMN06265338_12613 [Rhodoblastus acidophilus]|uniref:Uncharacterized protein n=1 Tax=Rhodoblastus acidophilus TaxID=1074 RepID=A0A212SDG2_RHOAC|nr:hypothetical protein [Rhodoblastus acidophilus]PPQ35583.1 hypothetical protein CKO16_20280 [Rhodoblastus acidophilus]RAI16992.1 hypothetical protein CH337_18450 [Rhodoblastus acidophilus]SNB83361.1 hypothetical protein SAMN06265338_12613 [Rhodoblastus acidophilus]
MNPCWIITEDGAFICGDFDSRVTSYSYPTSPNAEKAKRLAQRGIPAIMKFACRVLRVAQASHRGTPEITAPHDARNWRRINAGDDE